MSYRMYVKTEKDGERCQFLGNNVCPRVLIEELERQGAIFNSDMCIHDFEIKDIHSVIVALENYILEEYEWNKSERNVNIFDFEDVVLKYKDKNLTQELDYIKECCYMFTTVNFIEAIKDSIEEEYERAKVIYKIKENEHIYIDAF